MSPKGLYKYASDSSKRKKTNHEDEDDVDGNVDVIMNEDDVNASVDEDQIVANMDANGNIDVFDPRTWDELNPNMINALLEKGPKRDLTINKGPRDKFGGRFTSIMYTRILANKETCDREWLVYSKELDKLFCFCCKLLNQGHPKGELDNEGFGDWEHAAIKLKEHEVSLEHMMNMKRWFDTRKRFDINETTDKVDDAQYKRERDYWKQVTLRIISLIKFLAKQGLGFHGSNEELYEKSNDLFLGLIEMLEEFDPVIKVHVRRIMNDELGVHYLGHNIQNEVILLLAQEVKSEIIKKIKQAKYYSIILYYTPDTSHQEQMALIVRYVNLNSASITVEESFLGFFVVDDTSGKGLFDVTLEELKSFGLDINDMCGHAYANGYSMKEKHQGVQRRFLNINPRAFYTAYGCCHSLNLALCDIFSTCSEFSHCFGVIQRVYTIFADSTNRWQILRDNVEGLTLESLSTIRWESCVDSVKLIRFQLVDVREGLLEVGETDNDAKIHSEANSLAMYDLGDFDFLVTIVIWYELLAMVSKSLQYKDMLFDVSIEELSNLIKFFKEFREVGFAKSINDAKEIANEMGVDPVFPQRRLISRKKQFDETSSEHEVSLSPEENFKVNCFLVIVDLAIGFLESKFEQYQQYEKLFGFLIPNKLRELEEKDLKSCCHLLQNAMKYGKRSDIDGDKLYMELKVLQTFLPRETINPFDALKHVKNSGCFPNALIAYRILFTFPVTMTSAEESFSKVQLVKSYLQSTMSEEIPDEEAILTIENDILENMDYGGLVNRFATEKAKRASRFV